MKKSRKKVVLAYSGGLDTSIIVKWLVAEYDAEVIAFIADVGQNEDIEAAKKKAIETGAAKTYVADLKEEFARDFVFPAIKSGAVYEGSYLLGTSLARPLIARKQVEVALKEKAFAVSHGATGKGNDQVRFELVYHAFAPKMQIISPWREWDFESREDLLGFAKSHGIQIPVTRKKPYSCDRNLFHTSYEGGVLENPWTEPDEEMFEMTADARKAPDKPQYVEIDFAKGCPVAIDGKRMSPAKLIVRLNKIAGRHGIGRVDIVENRFVGMKSRGVYETPAGTVLHPAHRAVESLTVDREVARLKDSLATKISEIIYYGFWYSPEMDALMKTVEESQKNVTGTARMKLYKGAVSVVGRKAKKSLYNPQLATFEKDDLYNQADAEGFITLNALRLKGRRGG
ncbi:MAG: argininosuccinate synthase [Thermodesulfobacteriota bacterium]